MKYVYGPVPSRRLGRSLGVDLVPYKTCTFDCVYCQLGRTTHRTLTPGAWAEPGEIVEEIQRCLAAYPDYITLGGSGEPTLYGPIGDLIEALKRVASVPVAVLTNGSLLWKAEVRAKLREADLVIPSLDAGDEALFQAVNRPHPEISLESVHNGLVEFRRDFRGQYWLEALLLSGYTDSDRACLDIARRVKEIQPDRVQLNTAVRPPADSSARAVPRGRLERLAGLFDPVAEVIAEPAIEVEGGAQGISDQAILELLQRRPCSVHDLAKGLCAHPNEVVKAVARLKADSAIEETVAAGKRYFRAKTADGQSATTETSARGRESHGRA